MEQARGPAARSERILVVDDERSIAELVRDYLAREGFQARIEGNGAAALDAVRSWKPDLVVLDIMLPGIDGQELCRLVRAESDAPVIMVSARREEADKVLSFGLGADDYVTKPFSPGELVARVKAHLRRAGGAAGGQGRGPARGARLTYGELAVDLDGRKVALRGNAVDLSAREFDLLAFLARSPGQVFTRDQLFSRVWGENRFGDLKTVTVHVQRLREKLGEDPSAPRWIHTVWGVGYRFDA